MPSPSNPEGLLPRVRQVMGAAIHSKEFAVVEPDRNLFEDGTIDSFGILEAISALESEFGVSFSEDQLVPQNFWSLDAIVRTVAGCMETQT